MAMLASLCMFWERITIEFETFFHIKRLPTFLYWMEYPKHIGILNILHRLTKRVSIHLSFYFSQQIFDGLEILIPWIWRRIPSSVWNWKCFEANFAEALATTANSFKNRSLFTNYIVFWLLDMIYNQIIRAILCYNLSFQLSIT